MMLVITRAGYEQTTAVKRGGGISCERGEVMRGLRARKPALRSATGTEKGRVLYVQSSRVTNEFRGRTVEVSNMNGREEEQGTMDSRSHVQQEETKGGSPPNMGREKKTKSLEKKPGPAMMGGFLWRVTYGYNCSRCNYRVHRQT